MVVCRCTLCCVAYLELGHHADIVGIAVFFGGTVMTTCAPSRCVRSISVEIAYVVIWSCVGSE